MATEYYLIKPSKKEIFYLGKHFHEFTNIKQSTYTDQAGYIEYDSFHDFLIDFIDNHSYDFDDSDTWGQIVEWCYRIHTWCDAPVLLCNDCQENPEWLDWKETGSIYGDEVNAV